MYIYNPQNASHEELDRTLTPERRALAERLISRYLAVFHAAGSHYALVIAPRGGGKTHILTYIRHQLQIQHPNKQTIIVLSEEERGITSLLDFLLAMLGAIEYAPKDFRAQIRTAGADGATARAEEILDNLLEGRSALLVAENLSVLLTGLSQQELHALRAFLQRHPRLSVLASSVTLFERSNLADHPFHGFFTIHSIEPLDVKGAQAYLRQLAELKEDQELIRALDKPDALFRVKAIHALTGGNHRLLALLSGFLNATGLDELVHPFIRLIDRELTPYYQQRLDRLSPQQNKILNCIADHHGRAITVKEIADYTFTTSQTASSQLRDLLRESYVQRSPVGRESCYELREPLMRLAMDIKEGRDRPLPLVVSFLRNWYQYDELQTMAQQCDGSLRLYYEAAMKLALESVPTRVIGEATKPYVADYSSELLSRKAKASNPLEIPLLDSLLEGLTLENNEQYDEALNTYQKSIKSWAINDKSSDFIDLHAHILFRQGYVFDKLDRPSEALRVYEELINHYGESRKPALQDRVAGAMINRGQELDKLGRHEEALAACEETITRFGNSDKPAMQNRVARAMLGQSILLSKLNRPAAALAACNRMISKYNESQAPKMRENVAPMMFSRILTLGRMNRPEEELAACDQLIERYGDSTEPALQESVAAAMDQRGYVLITLKRLDEALAALNELITLFGKSRNQFIRKHVCSAMANRGAVLGLMNQPKEAIKTFDEFFYCLGDLEAQVGPGISAIAAGATANQILTLVQLGRYDEALIKLSEAFSKELFQKYPEMVVPVVAGSLFEFIMAPGLLARLQELMSSRPDLLAAGLNFWLKSQLPIGPEKVSLFVEKEKRLQQAFKDIPEVTMALEVIAAVRGHTQGDAKALLALPKEIRQLIETPCNP